MATPDGTKVLVVDAVAIKVFAISAPFTNASTVESLPLPGGLSIGFEDVGISADSQVAILAGNGGTTQPAVFITAPFTTAGATSYAVTYTGGRGNGAVRFLPP